MNPFDIDATGLLAWGLAIHFVADWLLQNHWMADNKAKRWRSRRAARRWEKRHPRNRGVGYVSEHGEYPYYGPSRRWYYRHPAAWAHAGIHTVLLAIPFGWPAVAVGLAHLVIDTRTPLAWWSRLIKQTQTDSKLGALWDKHAVHPHDGPPTLARSPYPLWDIGIEVRIWTDQAAHILTLALAALIVGVLS